jgi:hypothetical protein
MIDEGNLFRLAAKLGADTDTEMLHAKDIHKLFEVCAVGLAWNRRLLLG